MVPPLATVPPDSVDDAATDSVPPEETDSTPPFNKVTLTALPPATISLAPEEMSAVPPDITTVLLPTPPEETSSLPPDPTVSLVAVAPLSTCPRPKTVLPLSKPEALPNGPKKKVPPANIVSPAIVPLTEMVPPLAT